MKNKEITMIGLLQKIYNNNAPKKIKIYDDIFELSVAHYFLNGILERESDLFYKISGGYATLNDTVEILLEENEMKKMIYQKDRKTEILYHGFYKDYEFYILNLGTHPTAYVNVINNNLLAMKDYDEIDIDVHGGLTYSQDFLYINDEREKVKGWFIGWDYAHCNDYDGYEIDMPDEIRTNGKKWTTEEIFEDVKSVIEQCINYQENDEWEDIEELQEEGNFKFYNKPTGMSEEVAKILDAYFEALIIKINGLIKNQKYLKEKLDDNTCIRDKAELELFINERINEKMNKDIGVNNKL